MNFPSRSIATIATALGYSSISRVLIMPDGVAKMSRRTRKCPSNKISLVTFSLATGLCSDGESHSTFVAVGEFRTAVAFTPDLVRQFLLFDFLEAAFAEENGLVGQAEDGGNAQRGRLGEAGGYQVVTKALAMTGGFNCQGFYLSQVGPTDMQRSTGDDGVSFSD